MRIVGGQFRGRRLTPVGAGDMSAHLRPTTDRVRESLFNVLENNNFPALRDARVLDLFAGTGALGLEALSRGAANVLFVDDGKAAGALIEQNIGLLGAAAQAGLLRRNACRLGINDGAPYSHAFLDPPYKKGLGIKALYKAIEGNWLTAGALVIWEEAAEMPAPPGFRRLDARRYGDTTITILSRSVA